MLNVRSHSSLLLVIMLPPPLIPALLNNKWILSVWWRSATSSRNRSTCVRSATSAICVVTRSPCGNPAASQSLCVSARPADETSHIATLQASATSWRTSSRPIPLPPPVTTAVLPANSVMCTSLAFWGPSDTAFAYLSTGGEAQRGAMSGRQTPADLARELLEEIDIVGALGRPADQFIDLIGVWPDQNATLVGGAVGSTKLAAAMRAHTGQGRDRLPSCPHPVWSSIQFATGCRSDRGNRRSRHTPVR